MYRPSRHPSDGNGEYFRGYWICGPIAPLLVLVACGSNAADGAGGYSGGNAAPGTNSAGQQSVGGATTGVAGGGAAGTSSGVPSETGGVPGGSGAGGQVSTGGSGGAAMAGSGANGGVSNGGTSAAGSGSATAGTGAGTGGAAGAAGAPSAPGEKTVRVFWLRPSDVPFDQKYPDGIGKVMLEAQKYYKAELGKTFKLNTPIVETVVGDQPKTWYENTPNGGEKYWWSVTNMQQELVRKFSLGNPDKRWMVVGEVSAEGDGAGGGGSPGWVILCQHDADGAAGIGGNINRWYGGMVHELGHAFGLPDAASTDGTPMSASLYDYPNTHFSESQKKSILNGGQASFLF